MAAGPVTSISNGGSDVALERDVKGRLTAQPPFDRAVGPIALWASGCKGLPPLHMAVGVPPSIKAAAPGVELPGALDGVLWKRRRRPHRSSFVPLVIFLGFHSHWGFITIRVADFAAGSLDLTHPPPLPGLGTDYVEMTRESFPVNLGGVLKIY
jgi:hypothetical protein